MGTATGSASTLAAFNDLIWATSGTVGYRILLGDGSWSGTWTVDPSTDIITTAAANGWQSGQRIRLTTGGVLPALDSGSLSTTIDYFWIRVSASTGYLATTRAAALAGSPYLNFIDSGTGTHSASEQDLSNSDPIEVLIAKEISHSEYARKALSSLGTAVVAGEFGEKNPIAHSYSVSSGSYVIKYVLYLFDASSTPGDLSGNKPMLEKLSAPVTISTSTPYIATTILRVRNA